MVFGLIVLAAAAAFLCAWHIRLSIASLALSALALDVTFLFSWRTQFYITLLPLAPLLASVALTRSTRDRSSPYLIVLAGVLAGLSCYGYFIFAFLVPSACAHLWFTVKRRGRKAEAFYWLLGCAIGVAPYLLAYALIWHRFGTFTAFVAHLREVLRGVDPGQSQLDVFARVTLFRDLLAQSIAGMGTKWMMVAKVSARAPDLRIGLMLGLPLFGCIAGAIRREMSSALAVLGGFVVGLFCLVLAFGNRLWLHHFALLIPVLYLAMAVAIEDLARVVDGRRWKRAASTAGAAAIAVILGLNTVEAKSLFDDLARIGGVGLYSDAIDTFALESRRDKKTAFYFFPDWGVFMSFVMLTNGTVMYNDAFDAALAHKALCGGQDAVVVLVMGKAPDRVRAWTQELAWSDPARTIYHQRDGPDVLWVERWNAAKRPDGACAS